MIFGLQILNPSGNITFDSRQAIGGVCLGILQVPSTGGVYTYPSLGPGRTGFVINAAGGQYSNGDGFSYDSLLGYPRFTFSDLNRTRTVAIFVK